MPRIPYAAAAMCSSERPVSSVVISSLVVNTVSDFTIEVAHALSAMQGVEVHEVVESKLVVTLESETVDSSADVAAQFQEIPGVLSVNLIYVNFEDDPSLR